MLPTLALLTQAKKIMIWLVGVVIAWHSWQETDRLCSGCLQHKLAKEKEIIMIRASVSIHGTYSLCTDNNYCTCNNQLHDMLSHCCWPLHNAFKLDAVSWFSVHAFKLKRASSRIHSAGQVKQFKMLQVPLHKHNLFVKNSLFCRWKLNWITQQPNMIQWNYVISLEINCTF